MPHACPPSGKRPGRELAAAADQSPWSLGRGWRGGGSSAPDESLAFSTRGEGLGGHPGGRRPVGRVRAIRQGSGRRAGVSVQHRGHGPPSGSADKPKPEGPPAWLEPPRRPLERPRGRGRTAGRAHVQRQVVPAQPPKSHGPFPGPFGPDDPGECHTRTLTGSDCCTPPAQDAAKGCE